MINKMLNLLHKTEGSFILWLRIAAFIYSLNQYVLSPFKDQAPR